MTLAVSEFFTWGGTTLVIALFAVLAWRATRTRAEDRDPDA